MELAIIAVLAAALTGMVASTTALQIQTRNRLESMDDRLTGGLTSMVERLARLEEGMSNVVGRLARLEERSSRF